MVSEGRDDSFMVSEGIGMYVTLPVPGLQYTMVIEQYVWISHRGQHQYGSRLLGIVSAAQPMSDMQGLGEAMNPHTVDFQTIPKAGIL